eukprot:TRINITY_DN14936_c0_g1_i1.p1 TRINITY_DN14936_c0_g1~~TRINITY_DN14936_c0_g1_i1.p1  ORF type:complete len:629 (+),score=258.47 TRINITY_DN14936_c0_g1_i1:114-2000(+)
MEQVEILKNEYEALLDEYQKTANRLNENQEKMEDVISKIVEMLDSEENTKNERQEKQWRYEIQDLEKQELELEGELAKKRHKLVKSRRLLRSQIIERNDQNKDDLEKKKQMFTNRTSGASIQLSNFSTAAITSSGSGGGNSNDMLLDGLSVSPKEIECDKKTKLGSGAFGDVFKGKLRGKEVAVKKLTFQQFDQATLEEFLMEVAVMMKLRHPNVLLFMGACTSPGNLSMITELMPRGSVYDLFQNKEAKISFQQRMLFAKDTVMGMNWLHCSSPPILHLDLKTHNLLIDENWVVKVADFGLSRMKKTTLSKGKAGSPVYMAPEMLLDLGYDEKADIYSFGIVLWELFSQEEPYLNQFRSFDDLVEAVTKKGRRPEIPEGCPPKLKTLIQSCWNPSPGNRPTFAQILASNIFDEIIIENLISERNEMGREMWKESFLKQHSVPVQSFFKTLYKKIGITLPGDPDDLYLQCLRILLVHKDASGADIVTLEDFSRMLEWFGPLERGNVILQRIDAGLRQKGFFGEIETSDAEKILNGKKKGTYIIRFSTRDPGCYAITVLSKESSLKHYRILHKAGQPYFIGNNQYSSLDALIKAHKKDLYLKYPHIGSKYESMFNAHDRRLATQGYQDQ